MRQQGGDSLAGEAMNGMVTGTGDREGGNKLGSGEDARDLGDGKEAVISVLFSVGLRLGGLRLWVNLKIQGQRDSAVSNLLSGQEHEVEVMRSDAKKDSRYGSGGDAPERRKQWKVARLCYLNESGKRP